MNTTSQAKKKQNRGHETRQRILAVTQKLLADHDFYTVTLDQISKASEVSKSSLLWHFESKEMLLSEAACEIFQALEHAVILDKDDSLSLQEKADILLKRTGDYFDNNPEPKGVLMSLIFNSQIPKQIRKRIDAYWEHHIVALVEYFSYPDKPFSHDAAHMIMDVVHGCYIHWYLHQEKESFSDRLRQSFQYVKF